MKFTPGPWRSKELQVYNEKTGQTVAQIGIWGCKTEGEAEANALLISKAPEMCQVIGQLMHAIEHEGIEVHGRMVDAYANAKELLKEIEL